MYFVRWLADESITNVELFANSISSETELVEDSLPAAGWAGGEPQARANKGLTLFFNNMLQISQPEFFDTLASYPVLFF